MSSRLGIASRSSPSAPCSLYGPQAWQLMQPRPVLADELPAVVDQPAGELRLVRRNLAGVGRGEQFRQHADVRLAELRHPRGHVIAEPLPFEQNRLEALRRELRADQVQRRGEPAFLAQVDGGQRREVVRSPQRRAALFVADVAGAAVERGHRVGELLLGGEFLGARRLLRVLDRAGRAPFAAYR